MRKTFLLDTSVLLYDKTSIHSFPDSDVVIPLKVLDELDRFKDRSNLLGESARYVNRYLDQLRASGRLDNQVNIEESGQTIRVEIKSEQDVKLPRGLDAQAGDNIIIGTALYLAHKHVDQPLIVVTKDINLRVKCDALGLLAEDYYKDHVEIEDIAKYNGQTTIALSSRQIVKFFEDGELKVNHSTLLENQFVVGKGDTNQSLLGIYKGGALHALGQPQTRLQHLLRLEPRNKEQLFALSLLTDPSIPLLTLTGIAGSGKTFLALMTGLAALNEKQYDS